MECWNVGAMEQWSNGAMDWTSVGLIAIGGARNLFRFIPRANRGPDVSFCFSPFRLEAE